MSEQEILSKKYKVPIELINVLYAKIYNTGYEVGEIGGKAEGHRVGYKKGFKAGMAKCSNEILMNLLSMEESG